MGILITRGSTSLSLVSSALERECAEVPGVVEVRQVLGSFGGPVESVLEARFVRLLGEWGLPPPVLQHPIDVDGRHYRADVAWPGCGLIVEIDGFAHHSSREAFEHDRLRGNDLAATGLTVLRVTAAQVETRSPTLRRQIEAALAHRACQPQPA